MPPTLFMAEFSPPVRAVLMTAKAIGITLEHKYVNIGPDGLDQMKPEYLKMNPTHTIPTLMDEGLTIGDSHAIITYLVGKYGKDDSLYPKDLSKRAIVDHRLHFDCGILFGILHWEMTRPLYYARTTVIEDHKIQLALEAYGFVEKFLACNPWIAGDELTVADISVVSTLTSMASLVVLEPEKYPKTAAWLQRIETFPWYSENVAGLKEYERLVKMTMSISL